MATQPPSAGVEVKVRDRGAALFADEDQRCSFR
jgi:hypothetical protein